MHVDNIYKLYYVTLTYYLTVKLAICIEKVKTIISIDCVFLIVNIFV